MKTISRDVIYTLEINEYDLKVMLDCMECVNGLNEEELHIINEIRKILHNY